METSRYAPPKAPVADLSPVSLKRRSLVLLIVLSLVTFGLYYPIWFLRRRAALNQLDSPRKLRSWPFVVGIIWFAFQFVLGFAAAIAPPGPLTGAGTSLFLNVVQLALGILMVVQAFFTKDILEDHLAGPDRIPDPLSFDAVKLSALMTFFFGIFYLQYVINRDIGRFQSSAV